MDSTDKVTLMFINVKIAENLMQRFLILSERSYIARYKQNDQEQRME